MVNQNKSCLAAVCMVLACTMFVSCNGASKETGRENEVIFSDSFLSINMTPPKEWTTEEVYNYSEAYSQDVQSSVNHTSVLRINNSLKENVNGDRGISFDLRSPYYIGNKDLSSVAPEIDQKLMKKFGENYVYISNPPKSGFVYIGKKVIMKIIISHWPKNGITPEMESFFSSLHIN